MTETKQPKPRALLVALIEGDDDTEELKALTESAGGEVVGCIVQKREPEGATLFGKGKVEEIKAFIDAEKVDLVVCDNELSGVQTRNLTEAWGVNVVDRSSLILDIFAMRATSTEGKLQVELAQLRYNLPRLIGAAGKLGRYGGGIGMRGPGEKKLELDRRVIRKNIRDLSDRLDRLEKERELRRSQRKKGEIKSVALVGYTNAGKSTVMNALSKSEVLAENKLFATLDPVTRRVHADCGKTYLLTDTVGFVSKLPHEFIKAFSSTLEEARLADLLLIVMDGASKNLCKEYDVVLSVLKSLGIDGGHALVVYNKSDITPADTLFPAPGMSVSALTGAGMDELKRRIEAALYGEESK